MSEPVANVDIEDVLSSIRRLVSGGPDKEGRASDDARAGERLVLTPSQRVDAAEDAAVVGVTRAHPPEVETARDTARDTGADTARDTGADTEPDTAADADPVTDAATEVEADTATDPDTGGDADIAALLREAGTAAPDMPGTQAGMQDGSEPDPDPDPGEGGAETAADAAPETWAPETWAEPGAEARAASDADPDALDGIAAMFARHDTATPSAWEPDGDDEDAFGEGAEAPALDWRDFDAAEDLPEPDTFGTDDPDAGGRHARDHGFGPEDAGPRTQQDAALALEDEAVLDEEALRDLVAEIVREELMGTLGERITRNVRKLVRREIHRALNSQEFD